MGKYKFFTSLILIYIHSVSIEGVRRDFCEYCVRHEYCLSFKRLTYQEQKTWMEQYPCRQRRRRHLLVCCPDLDFRKKLYESKTSEKEFDNYRNPNIPTNGSSVDGFQRNKNEGETINPGPYYPNQENNATTLYPQQSNTILHNENNNLNDVTNSDSQCSAFTLPPNPATGCCGVDISDSTNIADLQKIMNIFASPAPYTNRQQRKRRQAVNMTKNENEDMLDDRIAGGTATALDQFPWTVHLEIIFTLDGKMYPFICGGALISSKYILTAAHCVVHDNLSIYELKVTLAEYDKRTFPIDCATVGVGLDADRECITNVLIHGKNVIIHPEYNNEKLSNDIALIELDGLAPYNKYIRPICLPQLNIDSPELSNLALAVAGWGRIGNYNTNIKQSTIVYLVPHEECVKSYSFLTNKQVCAAGYTGEDTCKGDSGGPLMLLNGANYYVVGIVSGKRSDSPCGTSVPSLYTNVFSYMPWIRAVIGG